MTPNLDRQAAEHAAKALWEKRLVREAWLTARDDRYPDGFEILLGAAGALLWVAGLYAQGRRNAADLRVNRVSLAFDQLPEDLEGFRILHLSDFHFRHDFDVTGLCAALRPLEIDLCVMTGDYAYKQRTPPDQVRRMMGEVLASLRAPKGVIGILGNHDRGAFVEVFQGLGVRMLVNEGLELNVGGGRVWVGGVDDPHGFRAHDFAAAMRGAPEHAFRILLAHSPELVLSAAAHGVDLYLCGHTHGGQVCLPVFGPVLLNSRSPRRYGSGAWQLGRMRGYTSAGVGSTGIPVRFNCPPEIAVLTLTKQGLQAGAVAGGGFGKPDAERQTLRPRKAVERLAEKRRW